jgi:hypothetical protein
VLHQRKRTVLLLKVQRQLELLRRKKRELLVLGWCYQQ